MTDPVIVAEDLQKSFGDVRALDGVNLQVEQGTVLGLLGPNGAGKTTAVRILTTLLRPDGGRATVAGFDVTRDAERLRMAIGLAGQYAAVDETLTGRENLIMVGRLYHLGTAEAKRRADGVLERFGLSQAGHRQVKTYSGGMRRRLDLGASLVGRPEILFLDEPTTGLDLRSRLGLWDVIRDLVAEGTTLLLTTQYLDEADQLANSIAVIDQGRVIAEGTADELKSHVGGEMLEIRVADRDSIGAAVAVAIGIGEGGTVCDNESATICIPVGDEDAPKVLARAVRGLDDAGIVLADIAFRRPTLDDVFLTLTGHAVEEPEGEAEDGAASAREPAPEPARR